MRLRTRALLRVEHEQEEVDAGRAGDHRRARSRSCPGTSISESAPAVAEVERRVAEVDRDAALLLLGQPVGVLAGQRPDEPRLAVVDVAGGADRQRHARTAAATSSISSSPSVRQSSSSLPSRTIPITGGSCSRSRGRERSPRPRRRRTAARQRQRAAADPRDRLLDRRRRRGRRAARRARARPPRPRAACGAPAPRAAPVRGRGRGGASLRARRGRACRSAARGAADGAAGGSTRSARPTTIPACGPPSSLSPLKQTRSAPSASEPRAVGSSPTSTKAPEPRSSSSGRPCARATAASSFSDGRSAKPTTRKFDWCTRRSSAASAVAARVVVGGARAVRRPDLDQPRAGAREHVGDAEAVADLDQLAARDEHLAALGRARRARAASRRRCC